MGCVRPMLPSLRSQMRSMRSGKQFGCPAHRRPLPPLYESSKNLPSREPCALGANGFFLTEFYHTRIRLTSSLIKFCRWEGNFAVRSPSGGYAQSRLVQQHKKLARTIPKQRPQARSTFNNENQETWECTPKGSRGRPQTFVCFHCPLVSSAEAKSLRIAMC